MNQDPPPAGPAPEPQFGGWAPPPASGSTPPASGSTPPASRYFTPPPAPQYPPQSGGWQPTAPQTPYAAPPAPGAPFAPTPPPKKGGRGKLIGSIAAVVVLAAGGVGTYVALSDSNQDGAASPSAAVQKVFTDLQKSDLLGVLDDLAPAERNALAAPLSTQVSELKRLHVFDSSADLHHVPGFTFSAHSLRFGAATKITDKVSVVPLTGGTIDVSYNAAKLPISKDFLAAVGGSMPHGQAASQHVDVADAPKPPQLAAQEVGGRWYPSLFYTVGYNAMDEHAPSAGDYIPADGADSPGAAAEGLVRALLKGDYRSAIGVLSPDEMAVVHDYGGMIASAAGADTGVTINSMRTQTTALPGGVQRVSLTSLVLTKDGQTMSMSITGDCVSATGSGQTQKFCADDITKLLTSFAVGTVCGSSAGASTPSCEPGRAPAMTAAQKRAFEDFFRGVLKIGLVTSQSGGKWYVNPVRSYGDIGNTITSQMKDDDLLQIIGFFKRLGH